MHVAERKALIRRWLDEDGYAVEEVLADGLEWLLMTRHNQYPILIGQEKDQSDRVTLRVQLNVPAGYRPSILKAPRSEALLYEMWFNLMSFEVGFTGLEPDLKELVITELVYDDALTKDTLLRRLRRVASAALLVHMTLSKVAREIEALPWEPAD